MTASGGGPLAGVNVNATRPDGSWAAATSSDSNGNYTIGGLTDGTYFLWTGNGQGYIDEVWNNVYCLNCTPASTGTGVAVAGAIGGINFALDVGARFSGTITDGSVPLQGVSITVYDTSGQAKGWGYTAADGTYTTSAVPAGSYRIHTFNTLGFIDQAYDGIACPACSGTIGTLAAGTAGAVTPGINFALTPGKQFSGRITDAGGTPIANSWVNLYDASGNYVAGSTTFGDGTYITQAVPAGAYRIKSGNSAGFINEVYDNVPCTGCLLATTGPLTSTGAAQVTPNIDFALEQGGEIRATVTSSAAVPLAGVWVQIYAQSGGFLVSVQTDANGVTYPSEGLPAGQYYVRTNNQLGFIDQLYNNIACATCNVTTGTAITVNLGVPTNIAIALMPGARISGVVTAAAGGAPLSGVNVWIYDTAGQFMGSGFTAADGSYATTGLAAGSYVVRTSNSSGYVDQIYNGIPCLNCNLNIGNVIALAAAEQRAGVNFALVQGGSISGTVTGTGGTPLASVNINIYDGAGAFAGATTTNASGVYQSSGLPAGTYYARTFNFAGYIDQVYSNIQCITSPCTVTAGTPINVTSGNTSTADFPLSQGGRIQGTVTGPGGVPLANISVLIYNSAGVQVPGTSTLANGTYASSGLPSGNYFIRTSNGQGYLDQLYSGVSCANGCNPTTGTSVAVTSPNSTTINFALTQGGKIGGTITGAGGAPLQGVSVNVYNSAGTNVGGATTNAAGVYLTSGLAAGTYYIRTFNSLGYLEQLYNGISCSPSCTPTAGTGVNVTSGNTSTINFALTQGARIGGTLTGAGGAPLASVNVSIYNSAGVNVTGATTNASGVFLSGALPAGNYFARTFNSLGYIDKLYNNISCSPSCTVTTGTPIAAVVGSTTTANFALAQGALLTGTITSSAGGGAAGVSVQVYSSTNTFVVSSAQTNASGAYTISGIAPGTYYLRTSNQNGFIDRLYNTATICFPTCTPNTGTAVALAVGSNTVNMTLDPGARITGTVTNNLGVALANVSVLGALSPSTTTASLGFTDANGNFGSTGLPAGTYWVKTSNGLGYVDKLYNNLPCPASNCVLSSGTGVPLAAGGTAAVNFSLDPGGRFVGTVAGPASGTVQVFDSFGVSVTSASILGGAYATGYLPIGATYYLRTSNSQNFIDQLYNGIICTPTCTVTTGTPLTPAAGNNTVNFALTAGGQITGNVSGPSGGVGGITVEVYSAAGTFVKSAGTSTTAGSVGNYTIAGLVTGSYLMRTRNTNLGLQDEVYTSPDTNSLCIACTITTVPSTPVNVTAGSTTASVNFNLAQGGYITGKVTDAGNGNANVVNASISVNGISVSTSTSTTTDANGNFKTTGLPSGTYVVRYNPSTSNNLAGMIYDGIACAGCSNQDGTPITVTFGSETPNINLALTHGGHITGTITDQSTSAPISSATVDIFAASGAQVTSASASPSGVFTTIALPPGAYFVKARAGSGASVGYIAKLYNNTTCVGCNVLTGTPIAVAADATTAGINFALSKGSRISGTVTDGASALAGQGVQIYNAAGIALGAFGTDATGNFITSYGLPAGTYFAKALGANGYFAQLYGGTTCFPTCAPTAGTPITVNAGSDTTGVNFTLSLGGRVSGTAFDATTSAALPGVTVLFFDAAGVQVGTGSVTSGGTFLSSALPTGTFHAITTNSLGYINQSFGGADYLGTDVGSTGTAIDVVLGATTGGVDFLLSRGGKIAGTITGPGGVPLKGVGVEIWTAPFAHRVTAATTNVLGQYVTAAGLPAGDYVVLTTNNLGYVNEIYNNIACVIDCNPAGGATVSVAGTGTTGGIDFALDLDADNDGDGINNTIDKNLGTGADEQGVASNDFSDIQIGGRTSGTITDRGGFTVKVSDLSSAGMQATATGGGVSDVRLTVCAVGAAEEIRLKAANDSAVFTCAETTGSTTIFAIAAATHLELRKTIGMITTVIDVPAGQSATIGSPAAADPGNTESLVVHILNAVTGEEIGTYTLDPGESAEAVANAFGDVTVHVEAGSVSVTIRGTTEELGEGQTQTFEAPDTTAPVITTPGNLTAEATSAAGATVTYTVTAADDRDGAVAATCTPASGSTFALGATTVNCVAMDAHGNGASASFTITVTPAATSTPGAMHGEGVVKNGDDKYHFDFDVREGVPGRGRNRFTLEINYAKRTELDKKGKPKLVQPEDNRFKATSFDDIAFSDDPTIRPGRSRKPLVDTVVFSGRGEWNGHAGYTFEVRAADEGEPGRHRESISIVIRDGSGAVVASASGELTSGNVQSVRIHGGGHD